MAKHALVHTDGASKGNPGRAVIGVAVYIDNELVPAVKFAERLPDCTNNVAEYTALLRGLDIAAGLGVETVEVRTDSELMAKQIAGSYSVKAPDLIPLYNAARQKLRGFRSGKVTHVRRGFNAVADELANVGVSLSLGQSKRIDADGIDLLLDLAGHTGQQRMSLFGKRAAPVQATYLGYPGSTGVPNMDWVLGDAVVTPEGSDSLYSERVARLPGTVFCFAPEVNYPYPTFANEVAQRPLTFGSFNNVPKVTPRTLRLWAQILKAVPEARLLLKAPSFSDGGAVRQPPPPP